jgi:hypothetical protein
MADHDLKGSESTKPEPSLPARRRYARPQIAWREPYEPVAFGISCAKQPGNPGCFPGPFSA